ncbi:AsnC family transcriptional regulator [Halarchaeum grantii]|uniref:AsnC family transcriptional regulator n=1 Tax=Halarchaeum grantii TaxID=1193105 RepID=A0A830F4M6_9EURY|nr:HTH-type transcriptional regulator Lrp [Halarchaeum grantii]GGL39810.1 AsnC family transcriptional regulator [Halarchaeum grantii]
MAYENFDTQLVNALLGNGRASLRNLAEELDVSVTTVSNHLRDLEDAGVITRYSPIVDYGKLGYDVTAILQLKAEGGSLPNLADRLSEHKQMMSVYEITGDYDLIAVGKFRDTDDMNTLIKELLGDADIKQSSTSVVLNTVAENKQFELDIE